MADKSAIEWTDATWNPVTGCVEVSEGCDHCYARTFAERWRGIPGHPYEQGFDVKLWPERLMQPLRWKRARRVFVNSMSDLFHDGVPDSFILDVFEVMADAGQHQFQVLTKRPGRMASLLASDWFSGSFTAMSDRAYPSKNVWLGTSVENQRWADIRIPKLLETPAAVRFLSCEPLLGPVELPTSAMYPITVGEESIEPGLGWVIAGGESGPGARPMNPDWVRSLRDQCTSADVPFFFKQWGGRTPKAGGRHLDARTWDQYPELISAVGA
jgi:protein gp37